MILRSAILAVALLLLGAGTAEAALRFAAPAGSGGACTEPSPCDLETAIEDPSVNDGDEIVLLPGPYNVGSVTLTVDNAILIRPRDPGTRPLINGTTPTFLLHVTDAATIRDLRLLHAPGAGAASALFVLAAGAVVERTEVREALGGVACNMLRGTLRDSTCFSDGGIAAAGSFLTAPTGTYSSNFVNVTAVGGIGLLVRTAVSNMNLAISARNVIASPSVRVENSGGATSSVAANLSSSNWPTSTAFGGPNETVTAPGTATNQTDPPMLVHAPGFEGDFHQLAGSPTINAGVVDPLLGTLDFDFEDRIQGPAPDIGADEFTEADPPGPPPPPPEADTTPPVTEITAKPKATVKTRKKKARYSVSFTADEPSTFRCSLDGKAAAPCQSPAKGKAGKGAHRFTVVAVDTAGNADLSPAIATWKVKRKR